MLKYKSVKVLKQHYRDPVTPEILDFSGSIFYHPDFLETAAELLNLEFCPIICYRNKEIAGIANIFKAEKLNVRSAVIPHLFQYYGPVSVGESENIFESIEEVIKDEFDVAVFSLTPEQSDRFSSPGWKTKNRLTYHLTPKVFKKMKSACFSDVKNKVNKAVKSGVEIAEVDRFPYDIYKSSFSRKKIKTPLGEYITSQWVDRLAKLKLAKTYAAIYEGKLTAFRTQLIFGKYACDWLAGADPSYNKLGVNQFLVLKIGERLYHDGIKNWDLLGGDIKSIADFKKSFGSKPVTHIQLEKSFSLKGKIYRNLMKVKARIHG